MSNASRRALRRRAFSLLELVIVIGIIAVLGALLVPAIQSARRRANQTACMNNLRQIGLAAIMYTDSAGTLPYARFCPAPWLNGTDPHCTQLPSPNFYTGPEETWWAPYDNRTGTTPTHALPGYVPQSILFGNVESSLSVFQCPDGFDTTQGSPTFGQTFQISYAMNSKLGGLRINQLSSTTGWVLAWDHDDLPACTRQVAGHWTMWNTDAATIAARHRPGRHQGIVNAVHCDGHVSSSSPR